MKYYFHAPVITFRGITGSASRVHETKFYHLTDIWWPSAQERVYPR
jgi:hypothetical protein